jgi:hypothetical protein
LHRCQTRVQGKKKFRFKNKLVSLDSTTIDLSMTLFDWARFRQTKGAIKLHLLLDHDGYLSTFAVITPGKVADIKVVPEFSFAPGTIVVDDRGYTEYKLWANGPPKESILLAGSNKMPSMRPWGKDRVPKTAIFCGMKPSNSGA